MGDAINRKIIVTEYSTDFRKVTKIVREPVPTPGPKQIVLLAQYLGVNASDINWTAGKYPPRPKIPFTAGFEAIGTVVAVGNEVTLFKVGDSAAVANFGSFADYVAVDQHQGFPLPAVDPRFLTIAVSGLTASIALEQSGRMTSGETVLVTAAAGGTGLYAVQLAKLAGNHVIGTCGSDEKIPLLKKLGCDRVINYKKENLNDVLRKEYPKGINIIYESVGGDTFEACLNNIAVCGRLIVIGMVSGYQTGAAFKASGGPSVPARLLTKSASVVGFFLNTYYKHFPRHYANILSLIKEKKLEAVIDPTVFKDLEQVADAIDHLYQGKNVGKVVVALPAAPKSKL